MVTRFVLLLALILAADASATPYTLAPGSLTHLTVRVTATDGFTSETAIDVEARAIDYGGATSEAFTVAANFQNEALFVENLDVVYGPMTFAGTVGAGAIPVSITFDRVDLSHTGSLGRLNFAGARLGDPTHLMADLLSGSLTGILSVDGIERSFSFQSENFCPGPCWPANPVDPDSAQLVALDDFDRFTMGVSLGGASAAMETVLVNGVRIAEVGGMTYRLEVASSAHGSLLQVIPEPSTPALIALGLLGLGLVRRA